MKTLEETVAKRSPPINFGETPKEIAIDETTVLIIDKPMADNVMHYLMRREPSEMFDSDQKIIRSVMDDMRKTLVGKVGLASELYAKYKEPLEIGKNTVVLSADHDFTGSNITADLRSEPKEVYILIPQGAKLNGKQFNSYDVDVVPELKVDGKIPQVFSNFLANNYGYKPTDIAKIHDYLFGTNFKEPPKQTNWRKVALITALVGAAAAIGLYSYNVNNKPSNPTKSSFQVPEKYTEPSKNTPLMQKI